MGGGSEGRECRWFYVVLMMGHSTTTVCAQLGDSQAC